MKLTYDGKANAFYMKIRKKKVFLTIPIHADCNIDMDKKGGIVGIEILNCKKDPKKISQLMGLIGEEV